MISLKYKDLFGLINVEESINNLIAQERANIAENGFPLCDFRLFVIPQSKRKMKDVFISCFRKVILLNKRRRAKLDHLIEIILNAKQNKDKL